MQNTEVKGFIIDRKVRHTDNGLKTYLAIMQPSGAFTIVEGIGQKFTGRQTASRAPGSASTGPETKRKAASASRSLWT